MICRVYAFAHWGLALRYAQRTNPQSAKIIVISRHHAPLVDERARRKISTTFIDTLPPFIGHPSNLNESTFPTLPSYNIFVTSNKTRREMKTATILAATLALQISSLFAANEDSKSTITSESTKSIAAILIPTTPNEAVFSETLPETTIQLTSLAPTTPSVADFNDSTPEISFVINLQPTTPLTADFTDSLFEETPFVSLAPSTPKLADFE